MLLEIVPAEASHVELMKGRFRPADIEELWAAAHKSPEECILGGIEVSPLCWTALFDGSPSAVFGVAPQSMLGGAGSPWMVGTVDLDRHAYTVMRHTGSCIAAMLLCFPRLSNFVDARNTKAIAWLKRLGFRFHDAEPHGLEGLPFYRFEMEADHV